MTSCASRGSMSSRKSSSSASGWLAALLLCAGCADFSRGEPLGSSGAGGGLPDGMGNGSDAGASSSYAADVQPLLLDGCESCHSPTGAASGTGFVLTGSVPDDYLSTLDFVDVNTPDASRLVFKMAGRSHGGGAVFTSASPEYAQVLRWIGEGAAP